MTFSTYEASEKETDVMDFALTNARGDVELCTKVLSYDFGDPSSGILPMPFPELVRIYLIVEIHSRYECVLSILYRPTVDHLAPCHNPNFRRDFCTL